MVIMIPRLSLKPFGSTDIDSALKNCLHGEIDCGSNNIGSALTTVRDNSASDEGSSQAESSDIATSKNMIDLITSLKFLSDSEYASIKDEIQSIATEFRDMISSEFTYELVDSIDFKDADIFSIKIERASYCDRSERSWSIVPYQEVVTLGQILHLVVRRAYKIQVTVPGCYAILIQISSANPRFDEIQEVELPVPITR